MVNIHRNYYDILDIIYTEINQLIKHLSKIKEEDSKILGETDIPLIDIYENDEDIFIKAEIPGVNPSNINIYISGNRLSIEGTKIEETDSNRINYLCMERAFGNFRRIIQLPAATNFTGIKATYEDGVLVIKLPKMIEKRGSRRKVIIR